MKIVYVTKYQVVTVDHMVVIREGFDTWEAAYHWALMVDDGYFDNHGGLCAAPYTARA